MKKRLVAWILILVFATLGFAILATAKADIVLAGPTVAQSFVDLGAEGFGNAHRLLDLHKNGAESGFVTPIDVIHDNAIGGADKGSSPTLSAAGWICVTCVGLGLNTSQEGNTGLTVQNIAVRIFAADNTTVEGTFSLLAPFNISAADDKLQQGNGNGVFMFALNAAERPELAAILAMPGSANFTINAAMTLGCPPNSAAGCLPSNGGQDSLLAFNARSVGVPGPDLGSGVLGVVVAMIGMLALHWRRRNNRLSWS